MINNKKPFIDNYGNYRTLIVISRDHSDHQNRYYFPDFPDTDVLTLREKMPAKEQSEHIKNYIHNLAHEYMHYNGNLPDSTPLNNIHSVYGGYIKNLDENIIVEEVTILKYWEKIELYKQQKSELFLKNDSASLQDLKKESRRSFWMIAYEIDDREGTDNTLEPVPFTMGDQGYRIYFPEFDDDLSPEDRRYYDESYCSEIELQDIAQEKLLNRIKKYYSKNACLPENKSKYSVMKECRSDFGNDFFDDDDDDGDDVKMVLITVDFDDCLKAIVAVNKELNKINVKNFGKLKP